MSATKRVLFLYIAISSGHQRAAEAVMQAMHRLNPRVASYGIDSFTYAYPVLGRLIARIYLEILKHTPQVWDYLYDNPKVVEATRELRQALNLFSMGKMYRLLKRFHPRALVCTQALPLTILANLKQRGRINLPLVGIVTDFEVHAYWLSRQVDLYLVGTEEIKRRLVREGIKESRIQVTGIPIDPHFAAPGDRESERIRFGLHPDKPTLLVTGGSRGLGPIEDVVATLRRAAPGAQILAVCGQNNRIRKRLQRRFASDRAVHVYGFTRHLPRMMDAADLLISKPGGMTCAESMAKGLPLVMIEPIPGQEERNSRYLLRHGAAERADSLEELQRVVHELLHNRQRLERLRARARAIARPHAAYDAAAAVLDILKEPVLFRPAPFERERVPSGGAV